MSVIGNKVRVYDLAREVKQDTKRIIEELRREGADVDVPSNSVSKELAEKIRNKYFPKIEAAPKRLIKVIKKKSSDSPVSDDHAIHETVEPVEIHDAEEVYDVPAIKLDESSKPEANKIKVLTPRALKPRVETPQVVEETPQVVEESAPVIEEPEETEEIGEIEESQEIGEIEETAPTVAEEAPRAATTRAFRSRPAPA